MRSFSILSVALPTALVVGACGQTPDSSEVDIDSAVVKSQSSALATAVSSAESNGGANIAEQLSEIGNTAAALIPRTRGASRSQLRGSASTCQCATASQKTCTFSSCKIGSATASGTVSWANGQLTCSNLVFDVAAIGQTTVEGESVKIGATHIAVACSFTYSPGSLDGWLRTTGSTTVNDVSYTWDASLTASDLAWTSKAFTDGGVGVNATVTAGADTFHATGSVSFP